MIVGSEGFHPSSSCPLGPRKFLRAKTGTELTRERPPADPTEILEQGQTLAMPLGFPSKHGCPSSPIVDPCFPRGWPRAESTARASPLTSFLPCAMPPAAGVVGGRPMSVERGFEHLCSRLRLTERFGRRAAVETPEARTAFRIGASAKLCLQADAEREGDRERAHEAVQARSRPIGCDLAVIRRLTGCPIGRPSWTGRSVPSAGHHRAVSGRMYWITR